MPASRPRARLIDGRSSGRPSRLLRKASVTNSSISLPVCTRHATHDGAGSLFRCRTASRVGKRVEEGCNQSELLIRIWRIRVAHNVEVGVEAIDRLGQHRVAEAIDRVRELGHDRSIEVDVVDLRRRKEEIDVGLNGARELFEHEMLVLHLGAELRGLEQPLAVPVAAWMPAWPGSAAPGVSSHSLRNARSPVCERRCPWSARPADCARSGRWRGPR